LALLVGIAAPLFLLIIIRDFKLTAPVPTFILVSLVTIMAGTLVHSLGAVPLWTVGGVAISGVKAQLVLPLLLAIPLLWDTDACKSFLEKAITWKTLFFGVFLVGTAAAVYLMRSGNYSAVPVSGGERHFRDVLEAVFTTRPRFKEFFVGHPLLILALFIKQETAPEPKKEMTWRILLWLGMIGQISIINTFLHFHTPYELCLLKSLHGLWLGALISLPICFGYAAFKKSIFQKKEFWPIGAAR
jgi:hypothetical protein